MASAESMDLVKQESHHSSHFLLLGLLYTLRDDIYYQAFSINVNYIDLSDKEYNCFLSFLRINQNFMSHQ